MHQSSSWCLWGPHLFATLSRMMPLFNAIEAQKIFWEFHISYVLIYEYIYIHICIHIYIHICSFVFPEACSASHIFLPCVPKLLVTKMKKSFIVALHSWLLSPLWSRAMVIYVMNAKVVTRDKNKAMLLVVRNKQSSMAKTFSVFFKHLFVVIVIYHNHTQQGLIFYILQVEGRVLCKEIGVFYGYWYRESNNFCIERWRKADVLSEGNRILF